MTDQNNQVAVQENPFTRASTALSQQLGLEPRAMVDAIKTQFFKGKEATDAQLAVVVSTARALGLNPLLPGQLYPYPDRSGAVTIMLGPDGIFTLLANNLDVVAQKDGGPAYWTEHGKDGEKEICTGFINHRTKGLLKKTIWVDEWSVSSNPNWSARRHHMAEIRALKQAARMVIHGIPPDSDEKKLEELTNVTGTAETPTEPQSPPPQPRAEPKPRKGAAAAKEAAKEVVVEQEQPKTEAAPEPAKQEPKNVTPEPETPKTVEQPKQAPAADKTARAFLKDGEKLIANVEVVSLEAVGAPGGPDGKQIPSVRAVVKGDYNGKVQHKGGGRFDDKGVIAAAAPWEVGSRITLHLAGKKSTAEKGPMVGQIIAWVEKAEAMTEDFG